MKKMALSKMMGICVLALLAAAGCLVPSQGEIKSQAAKFVGEGELKVRLVRRDTPHVYFGNGDYWLDERFLDFDRPQWWSDLRKDLIETRNDLLINGYKPSLNEVPSEEWLRQNATRVIKTDYWVKIALPSGSALQRRVTDKKFVDYVRAYPDDKEPRSYKLDDAGEIYSIWKIYEGLNQFKGEFTKNLQDIQETYEGQLTLTFPKQAKDSLLVIQLPEQLMKIDPASLPPGYSQTFTAKAKLYYLQ